MLYNVQNVNQLKIPIDYAKKVLEKKGKVSIFVEPTKKKRTSKENSYYFGVIIDLSCQESGNTPADQHEIFKDEILGHYEIQKPNGQIIYKTRSTAELTTVQFEDYAEHCRAKMAEWYEIMCPKPNEVIPNDEMFRGV